MTLHRVYYVTQGYLRVWVRHKNQPASVTEFADDDSGLRDFDNYLSERAEYPAVMLVDVIEEEFVLDTIPKLGRGDRRALVERRGQRRFRRTPYRVSIFQGKASAYTDQYSVVHSAISNHELVDPWLQIMLRHGVPLSGVFSVPLIAPSLFKKLFTVNGSAMFVAPHQGNKLRQVFVQDGNLRSARLSQSPGISSDDYASFVVTEVMRSRRYLERTRLLAGMEIMEVCVVADDATAEKIATLAGEDGTNQYAFVAPELAANTLGLGCLEEPDRFEEVYLDSVSRRRPAHNYARSDESRFWRMQQLRNVLIGVSAVTAACCSVFAAVLFSDAWIMSKNSAEMQSQVEQLSATFRRENESFNPIKADSHEMKLAVDTGDFILRNRLPVPWVMNQLGTVLGNYPDIKVQELRWMVESAAPDVPTRQRGSNDPVTVVVPQIETVAAVLTGDIEPFDGNLRRAFARIDELASELRSNTHFGHATVLEYPFDANINSAVSGEITGKTTNHTARFQMRVSYAIQSSSQTVEERSDESI